MTCYCRVAEFEITYVLLQSEITYDLLLQSESVAKFDLCYHL